MLVLHARSPAQLLCLIMLLGLCVHAGRRMKNPVVKRKLPRVKTFLYLHYINNVLRHSACCTLRKFTIQFDKDMRPMLSAFLWAHLNLCMDRASPNVCADHYLAYEAWCMKPAPYLKYKLLRSAQYCDASVRRNSECSANMLHGLCIRLHTRPSKRTIVVSINGQINRSIDRSSDRCMWNLSASYTLYAYGQLLVRLEWPTTVLLIVVTLEVMQDMALPTAAPHLVVAVIGQRGCIGYE